ncbi:hypothetical protein [Psychrobacter sp. I-STPA6b]|uniref:hypothetical protein n=1 Tax=Psychrobacter sp. I-STPA6b TaxID=2585718 RepID=UPI001D0BFA9A|nr:hypothetical protein [Psychrobacter sp. I-STPA6b]
MNNNTTSIKRKSKSLRLYFFLIIFTIFIIIFYAIYKSQQKDEFLLITYDLCRQQQITILASQLGLDYKMSVGDAFEFPTLRIIGNTADMQNFRHLYHQTYADNKFWNYYTYDTNTINNECHLYNMKYHVDNINEKLLPFIPNNADHVSYDSKADNAVYCYYTNTQKGGSQCYFISLHDDILQKDDISDMEKANLEKLNQLYSLRRDMSDLRFIRSQVYDWNSNPTQLYGFRLHTNYDGNRWGIVERY